MTSIAAHATVKVRLAHACRKVCYCSEQKASGLLKQNMAQQQSAALQKFLAHVSQAWQEYAASDQDVNVQSTIQQVQQLLHANSTKENNLTIPQASTIGIVGLGIVGSAMYQSMQQKILQQENLQLLAYDKYKPTSCINLQQLAQAANIVFLALPTPYNEELASYDYSALVETCATLSDCNYKGTIVVKSTVEPMFSEQLNATFSNLNMVHNPEFLTAKTAMQDFDQQSHIVLGKTSACSDAHLQRVSDMYQQLYPNAKQSLCTSNESECMKLFCNNFYAVKIQFCNELYVLCKKLNVQYDNVMQLMLRNGWINPMHTRVPGTDGKLSYGGMCFPKDTNALLQFMKKHETRHDVLSAVIAERNDMRDDHNNCIKK